MSFTISLFSCAADNEPTTAEIPSDEVFEHLSEREILPDDGLDSQQALKVGGSAWSPSTFRGTRADANVVSASLLVFDFDKDNDKQPGVTNESLVKLRAALNAIGCRWMLCSTFSSGFVAPRHKLRAVLPLERPVSVQEYTDLWDAISARLPVKPDSTRRHPGGIFFTPRVFEAHLSHWVFECRKNAANLGVGKLDSKLKTKKTAPDFGRFNVSAATVAATRDWYEHVATAEEKHHALNTAAFALASSARDRGEPKPDLWPKLEAALKRNPGQPVKDWRAAERTVARAIDDAYARPAAPEADPLAAALPETAPVTEQLRARAQKQLEKWERRVKKNPELAEVTNAAVWLGKFAPHVYSVEHVTSCLRSAARNGRSQASDTDLTTAIDVGLAKGMRAPEGRADGWAEGLAVDDEGRFLATDENLRQVFARHPDVEGVLGTDVRSDCVSVRREPPWETIDTKWPCAFRECEAPAVATWLCTVLGCRTVGADKALRALTAHAGLFEYDEFKEYLESLTWDGTPRLDTWLSTYVGAPDNEYTRAVGSKWVISAVARAFRPGCQVDTALILQGPQGIGKSSAFVALLPDERFVLQNMPDLKDKDIHVAMGRYVISEMAELTAISRKDVNHVKEFITIRTGKVRTAYARFAKEIPRRGVLAGSTNAEGEFLTDVTGGRRFWIVRCTSPDVVELSAARDQLWAEAVARFAAGAKWYLTKDEEKLAAAEVEKHTEKDDLLETLEMYLTTPLPGTLIGTIDEQLSGVNTSDSAKVYLYPNQLDTVSKLRWVTVAQVCDLLRLDVPRHSQRARNMLTQLGYVQERRRVPGREEPLRLWAKVGAKCL